MSVGLKNLTAEYIGNVSENLLPSGNGSRIVNELSREKSRSKNQPSLSLKSINVQLCIQGVGQDPGELLHVLSQHNHITYYSIL